MMDSSTAWDNQDPTLSVPSQDDFQQFLDMGMNNLGDALQFDFQDFNQQHGQDTSMQEHMAAMTTASSHTPIPGTPINGHGPGHDSLVELDAQIQYLQHQRHQQQQRQMQEQQRNFYVQSRMVPPTPNSVEMHGAASQFYPQSDPQQQAMYERFRMQVKEQEMAFTPLVSPAVTPLDAHFNIPEYTIPGAYFSPLSSPALHAQNEQSAIYDQRLSGTTNSPIDMNLDTHSAPASSVILSRKPSRKSIAKPRSARAVRQSPIVKPRRGKKGSTTSLPSQALGDILEPSNAIGSSRPKEIASSNSAASTEESENGSISPEHLSEMAPPPIPSSAGRPSYTPAQKNPTSERLALGSPATPASLMRLTQSPSATSQPVPSQDMDVDLDDQELERFALPEAANVTKPPSSRIELMSDGQTTPTLSSSSTKALGFQALPSPIFARPGAAASSSQSPLMNPTNSSNGASRRTPQVTARGSKKRSSASVLASPALLPRISPSIKPLLPGGGGSSLAEDTASLLLASKSNYQNILEGTHLPGVSYPTELSTNLTSKRTSHKIAEQGRRNRINSALQEIATLLPRPPGKESGGEKSGSGDAAENENGNENGNGKGGGQSANSKASTVELAIDYIKELKQEVADQKKRAEEAERKLLTLK